MYTDIDMKFPMSQLVARLCGGFNQSRPGFDAFRRQFPQTTEQAALRAASEQQPAVGVLDDPASQLPNRNSRPLCHLRIGRLQTFLARTAPCRQRAALA